MVNLYVLCFFFNRQFKQSCSIFKCFTGDLFFICGNAQVPAVSNLPYNNNAQVKVLESTPRTRLRAFEKKNERVLSTQ